MVIQVNHSNINIGYGSRCDKKDRMDSLREQDRAMTIGMRSQPIPCTEMDDFRCRRIEGRYITVKVT